MQLQLVICGLQNYVVYDNLAYYFSMIELCEAGNVLCYTNPVKTCSGVIDPVLLTAKDCCRSASRRSYSESGSEICEVCPECKPAVCIKAASHAYLSCNR